MLHDETADDPEKPPTVSSVTSLNYRPKLQIRNGMRKEEANIITERDRIVIVSSKAICT
jgi:hypothetical protein